MALYGDVHALQLAGGVVRPAILFRLEASPMVRAWSGPGDLSIPADAIEPAGGLYEGVGALTDLPALQQLVNGAATRVDFQLSGVSDEIAELADADADSIRGASVFVGLLPLNEDWQPAAPVAWLWEGEADVARVEQRLDRDNAVNTIAVSVGSAFTGRRRPRFRTWTNTDQQRRSPGDRFCERVALYGNAAKTWPRF